MIKKYSDIDFYVDCLVVEAALSDKLVKNAEGSMISSLIDSVKSFFTQNVKSDNMLASLLGFLAPTAVYKILDAMGFKWFKWLASFLTAMYSVDIVKLISGISEPITRILSGGNKVSAQEVSNIVDTAVDSTNMTVQKDFLSDSQSSSQPAAPVASRTPAAPTSAQTSPDEFPGAEAGSSPQKRKPAPQAGAGSDDGFPKAASINMQVRQAYFCKLEVMAFKQNYENNFVKNASPKLTSAQAIGLIPKFKEVLKKIFKWFFMTALGSVGFLIAGKALNSLFGRTPEVEQAGAGAGAGTGAAAAPTTAPKVPAPTQKKFPVRSSYKEENYKSNDLWSENVPVNEQSVESLVVDFAKEVYDKLEGKENIIRSTNGFNAVVSTIYRNNFRKVGGNILVIPTSIFSSKKQIVDTFIDEVAAKSP